VGLYLYTKGWSAALGEEIGDSAQMMDRGRALLGDPAACSEAIGRYQGGRPLPAFAGVRPDLAGIEARLALAEGKAHIVVVGNGGSIRNVWALYGALAGGGAARELHLLDGTDPSGLFGELAAGGGRFSPANTLLVSVSKSGDTENVVQETRLLAERGYPVLAVIGPGPSKLAALAEERGFDRFPHPEEVGGRFTAGQNTALLPLSLALGGADAARAVDAAFEEAHSRLAPSVSPAGNMAKALALELWRAELGGYTELFLPIYCKALTGLGELIVQLVHESYCKSGKGQTVLFAQAPESQHHTNQRYFGGRRNMAALSVRVQSHENDMSLRGEVSAADFLDLEHAGVAAEADRRGTPQMTLTLDGLGVGDVASAIALWQWAAVYGGLLREVNPFDQPAVEGSKTATIEMFEGFGPPAREALERFTREASHTL
jgi:glucose-6-phosphate isomerase